MPAVLDDPNEWRRSPTKREKLVSVFANAFFCKTSRSSDLHLHFYTQGYTSSTPRHTLLAVQCQRSDHKAFRITIHEEQSCPIPGHAFDKHCALALAVIDRSSRSRLYPFSTTMVYDPIRDCEVPSPAASIHNPSPWADTPQTDPRGTPTSGYPPHFQHDGRSPAPVPLHRTVSGGLRGLLNDDGPDTRRSSGRDSMSSIGHDDNFPQPHRGRINNLLHESATPLSQSSSHSSMGQSAYSQHSHHSPVSKPYSLLDHDGFLAPVTPASAFPRASRSPYSLNSPSGYPHAPLPMVDGGPLRSPYPTIHDSMPLRSPSISVSPRQYHQSLPPPHPHSRPGSSSSASGFAFNAPSIPLESPSIYQQRQASSDYTSRPRSGSRTTGPPSRRPSASLAPPKSPSPPPRIPYQPHNRTSSSFLLNQPITQDELESLKLIGHSNNSLRRRPRRPPPSWSGPSPSPGLRRTSGPHESDASYFPRHSPGPSAPKKRKTSDKFGRDQDEVAGRSGSETKRRVENAKYMGNVALVADHCEHTLLLCRVSRT